MGLCLHDDGLQLPVVLFADVIFPLETLLLGFQLLLLAHLEVGLERVEDGGADEQVGERAHDQGQCPQVLPLHGQQEAAAEGLMSPWIPREGAARVGEASRAAAAIAGGGGGAEKCAPVVMLVGAVGAGVGAAAAAAVAPTAAATVRSSRLLRVIPIAEAQI